MTLLTEGDLQISFSDASSGRKFDDEFGMSHCMKAVDFIVEFSDRYLFIELKDPQNPKIPEEMRQQRVEEFKKENINNELKYKYRDTYLYEWASGKSSKPIYFFVLIAVDSLNSRELVTRTDALRREIPVRVPRTVPWIQPIIKDCAVFNIYSWNRHFPKYPVMRLSASSSSELTVE